MATICCVLFVVFHALTVTLSTADGSCPRQVCLTDWVAWNSFCYKRLPEILAWAEGVLECQAMGAEMIAPSSQEESQFLLSEIAGDQHFSVNCNDIKDEGHWDCKDYSGYLNWYSGEPNGGLIENCALMGGGFGNEVTDFRCSLERVIICKDGLKEAASLRDWRLLLACHLSGFTVRQLPVPDVRACATVCTYDPDCRSFNVLHLAGGDKMCQIKNDTRSQAHPDHFLTKMQKWNIYAEK